MPRKKKTKNKTTNRNKQHANPLGYHEGGTARSGCWMADACQVMGW